MQTKLAALLAVARRLAGCCAWLAAALGQTYVMGQRVAVGMVDEGYQTAPLLMVCNCTSR